MKTKSLIALAIVSAVSMVANAQIDTRYDACVQELVKSKDQNKRDAFDLTDKRSVIKRQEELIKNQEKKILQLQQEIVENTKQAEAREKNVIAQLNSYFEMKSFVISIEPDGTLTRTSVGATKKTVLDPVKREKERK